MFNSLLGVGSEHVVLFVPGYIKFRVNSSEEAYKIIFITSTSFINNCKILSVIALN